MNFDFKSIETNLCIYISKSESYFIITFCVDHGLAICSLSPQLEDFIHYNKEFFFIICFNVDVYEGLHIVF